jgi:hypothetical protein
MNKRWLAPLTMFDTEIPVITYIYEHKSRSQWPRGLRRRSTAARLLRSLVRIPPGAWMFVVCVMCCQVEVSATSWSLVQRSPTDCGASLCLIKKPRGRGGYSPRWAAEPEKIIIIVIIRCIETFWSPCISLVPFPFLSLSGNFNGNWSLLGYSDVLIASQPSTFRRSLFLIFQGSPTKVDIPSLARRFLTNKHTGLPKKAVPKL